MHDIDRVSFEAESFETGEYELNETGEVFGETENMELASELLEVAGEAELEGFLGSLIAKAGKALGQFAGSPEGQALVGVLKGAAHKALPTLGASVGRYLAGDSGAKLGAQLASAGGKAFGLELEGLSNEDREFEVARRFVDFAGEAVRNLGEAGGGAASPVKAAAEAAMAAARTHAPGLVAVASNGNGRQAAPDGGRGRARNTGRWVQRGSKIILYGV